MVTNEQYILNPVLKGKVVSAQYNHDQVIKTYIGNPLIESLPPILEEDELLNAIPCYPNYDQSQRSLEES